MLTEQLVVEQFFGKETARALIKEIQKLPCCYRWKDYVFSRDPRWGYLTIQRGPNRAVWLHEQPTQFGMMTVNKAWRLLAHVALNPELKYPSGTPYPCIGVTLGTPFVS